MRSKVLSVISCEAWLLLRIPYHPSDSQVVWQAIIKCSHSSIDSVIYSSKFVYHSLDNLLYLILLDDVQLASNDLCIAVLVCFEDCIFRFLQTLLVQVGYGNFSTAFSNERNGNCLSDAFIAPVSSAELSFEFRNESGSPDADPVMNATPGKSVILCLVYDDSNDT